MAYVILRGNGSLAKIDLGRRITDRGGHTGSECARLVEQRRRPDRHSVRRPVRIGLHTDPVPDR
jgi:hypothetical protein